jgi:hypothetical protein
LVSYSSKIVIYWWDSYLEEESPEEILNFYLDKIYYCDGLDVDQFLRWLSEAVPVEQILKKHKPKTIALGKPLKNTVITKDVAIAFINKYPDWTTFE